LKPKTKHKLLAVFAVILIGVILGATAYLDPSFYNVSPSKNELLSASQIYVDPQGGSNVNGQLENCYWNLVASVDAADTMQAINLPANTTGTTAINGVNTAVKTQAGITVEVTPEQPYLIEDLQTEQVMVAPAAQGTTGPLAPQLTLTYYAWGSSGLQIFTPYQVTVLQNGNQIGQATINTAGTGQSASVSTSDGTIIINNIGELQDSYMTPDLPSQIAIFAPGYIYDWSQIQNMVSGKTPGTTTGSIATQHYADYWYGVTRNSANEATDPVIVLGFEEGNLYEPSGFGGWEGSDSGGSVTAVQPVIYASNAGSLPADKRSFDTLTEWIQAQGVTNLATTTFASGSMLGDYSLVTDTNGATALKILVPWGAYQTPLTTIKIPVSLANTIIDEPQVSNVQVSATWQANGGTTVDNAGQEVMAVTCTQDSTVTSSALITVTSSGSANCGISPNQQTVTLAAGASTVIYFDISNLGENTAVNNVPVTATAYTTEPTQTETSSSTIYANFLATLGQSATTLNILVHDATPQKAPVVGLQVSIQYPPTGGTTLTAFTDSTGSITQTLATSAGAGYSGQVFITTAATAQYNATYTTVTVKPGQNSVVITVGGTPKAKGLNWELIILIIAIIATIIVIVAVIAYAKKKGKHPTIKTRKH
jgi:hypothetical protein